jgi:hypothetical protein
VVVANFRMGASLSILSVVAAALGQLWRRSSENCRGISFDLGKAATEPV